MSTNTSPMDALSMFYFPPYLSTQPSDLPLWTSPGERHDNNEPDIARGPVLVVEDDPAILSSVADILEFEGYSVETATDGAQGLSVLERVTPTLILLDMRMPVLNGWD